MTGPEIAALRETIYKRRSTRSFKDTPLTDDIIRDIRGFIGGREGLTPRRGFTWELVSGDEVRCILPWRAPHNIAMYTDGQDMSLVNVGFVFQQVDLYLQSRGLAACWLGMGRVEGESANGDSLAMMLAFGEPKGAALRSGASEFKRTALTDISDQADERLEPARLAPSSVNSQPWYFVHEGNTIHTYCAESGLVRKKPSRMNLIDVGIALAHIYVSYPDGFRFFRTASHPELKGRAYIGSFTTDGESGR